MRNTVRFTVGFIVMLLLPGCREQSSANSMDEALSPVAAQSEDRRETDLVIFLTDTPGKGAWGIMQNGWHVDAVEVSPSRAFRMPTRLVSIAYPGVVMEVRDLPEPGKNERVLADASGKEGVQLGTFFGGMKSGKTPDGKHYATFESYVGAQLWRLRFTATSDSVEAEELEAIVKDFVKTVRPGSPMMGLMR